MNSAVATAQTSIAGPDIAPGATASALFERRGAPKRARFASLARKPSGDMTIKVFHALTPSEDEQERFEIRSKDGAVLIASV